MAADTTTTSVLEDLKIPVRQKLAALWASVMFVYAYVDILAFYKPGAIEGILAGRVWELDITQTWAVGALALMTIPTLMILLSLTLRARASRVTNIVVASLFIIVSASNAAGESWVYYFSFAAVVEITLLVLVIRNAAMWPRAAGAR